MGDMYTRGDYVRYNGTSEYAKELNNNKRILSENAELENLIEQKSTFHDNTAGRLMNKNSRLNLLEAVNIRGTERAFGFFLCETYYKSLVIDDDFKKQNENQIKSYFIEKLKEDANGDVYRYMNECAPKSGLLKILVEECKKKGAKLEKKAAKKLDEDGDFDIDDYLNDDDDNGDFDINYDKADVNEISNIVKDKVIQVIKDEEEKNKEAQDFIDDINNAKSVSENAGLYIKGNEQFSLYKSMMLKNNKEVVKALSEGACDTNSVYGSISENNEIKVNMDYVMFDTILEYTNMELMNTMKIKDYSSDHLRKYAEDMAYAKVQ